MSAAMTMLGGLWRRQGVRVMSTWNKKMFTVKDQQHILQVVQSVSESHGAGVNVTEVLSKFVVPSTSPFPTELHGIQFPLEELRTAYVRGHLEDEFVHHMDEFGIVWVEDDGEEFVEEPKSTPKKSKKNKKRTK
ncbi:hypothetical protein H310_13777 [Aphanomyces invadans]|uniref:Uncharacterized protein n=1 Tax=Aphanomyces invadans TaxID=157072 RepID=A0A024TCC9_9STRA|nr:hypothetical protein H310_13777 [Aphanomyces invadans]ETV91708.1 hypothetical protein H310_13777 [Aphanomyces invadans]RHY26833.1 hypothetical protein DYB32_007244 [Aphanomyces invadans]|eukprot:XP_008879634.1 hypothetical protein H310_13777 [Aphanomyces invadans]